MQKNKFNIIYYSIETNKLKNRIRIAFIADLHLEEYGERNIDLIKSVKSNKPDIIILGGDIVNKQEPVDTAVNLCEDLAADFPVYFGVGNHELRVKNKYHEDLFDTIKQAGVTFLDDNYVSTQIHTDLVDIGGLNGSGRTHSKKEAEFAEKFLKSKNFKILVSHDPLWFDAKKCKGKPEYLGGKGIDVALCGHRHGGQINIPLVGPMYAPDYGFFPQLVSGCHTIDGTHVVISRGLGNPHIIPRINNPKELVIVDLY